jgi:O-antigen/teichoic acid export membrane protein
VIKNVVNTVGSKLGISLISFVLLLLNSNYLGAAGLGSIGLIVLSIAIVLLLSNLVSTSIIYYASRHSTGNLFFVSYLWSIISVIILYFFNQAFPIFPKEYANDIYILSFIQSGIVIHLNVLLGKEKIKHYNIYTFLQSLLTLTFLCSFFFIKKMVEVQAFIYSLYLAYGLVLLTSSFNVIPLLSRLKPSQFINVFKDSISYGIFVQSANIFQLLNYRISYFILDMYSGRASLGIYSAGVQLSEALLIPGKSISTVQYARISAKKDEAYAQRITILFMKLSIFLTGIGTLLLMLLPTIFLTWLLGESFMHIKSTILAMSLGIIALSAEIILSHYFSGTGRQKKNSVSSLIGLCLTLVFAYLLIPKYGAVGAAITSSIAFSGMLVYLVILMSKQQGMSLSIFFPKKTDWILIRRIIQKYRL